MVTKVFAIFAIFCIVNLRAQKISLEAQYVKEGQYKLMLKNNTSKSTTLYLDLNGFGYGDKYHSFFSEEYFLQLNMHFLDQFPPKTDFPIGVDILYNVKYGGKYDDLSEYIESCKLIFKPYEIKQRYVYLYDKNRVFPDLSKKEFGNSIYLELPSRSIKEFLKKKHVSNSIIKNVYPLKSNSFNTKVRLKQWE